MSASAVARAPAGFAQRTKKQLEQLRIEVERHRLRVDEVLQREPDVEPVCESRSLP
jgi:hypothetical protein